MFLVLLGGAALAVAALAGFLGSGGSKRGARAGRVGPADPGATGLEEAGANDPAAPAPDPADSRSPAVAVNAPGGTLGPLRLLRGRVRWRDGAPVAGADIVLFSSPFTTDDRRALALAHARASHVTDAEGWFRVAWVPGGLWSLQVLLNGSERASVVEPPAGDELEIVLVREAAALEVEAVDAATGDPVKLAAIQLHYAGGMPPQGWRRAWLDPGRGQRWSPLPSGEAWLYASATGHEHVEGERVVLREGETARVRLVLHRGQTVRGTVVDAETGAPAAGARLGLVRTPWATETDARGRFERRLVPWDPRTRRTLVVHSEGYAVAERLVGHVDEDGGVEEVEIKLVRPAALVLRCVDGTGRGLENVLVIAHTFVRIHERSLGSDRAVAVTDADGRASLTIAPGDVGAMIECWLAGARVLEREFPPLRASELRDLGEVVVGEAKTLRGVVFTAEGAAAAGSFVVVEPHDPADTDHDGLAAALMAPGRCGRVDARGRFEVRGLAPGLWDLLVHGGGHARLLRVGIAVLARGEPAKLDLRLPVAISLEGRVIDARGNPVPRASVAFLRSYPVGSNLLEKIEADEQGRFSIPGFTGEDGDVELSVRAPVAAEEDAVQVQATPRDGPIEIRLP